MRRIRLAALPIVAVCACLTSGHPSAQAPAVPDLLDRYAAGRFDEVVAELASVTDFHSLLKQLRDDGPAWIAAGGPAERPRRTLAAATFALEAARMDEWWEWKWRMKQPVMTVTPAPGGANPKPQESYQPFDVLTWQPAPLFIEWGCELLRHDETPSPIERWWQLAAVAVAERGEDAEFLIGDANVGLGEHAGEVGNQQTEFKHLDHAIARFPKEPRFVLAQGVARAWVPDLEIAGGARQVFEALSGGIDVGGEATMRLGEMELRRGRAADAVKLFDRAEGITRDRYVVYLARYFTGQAYDRQKRPADAREAYRRAAATIPHAQAASIALAAALFLDGRRSAAQQLAGEMLAADPPPPDPWREYAHADDRFWPQLVGHLRAEIRR